MKPSTKSSALLLTSFGPFPGVPVNPTEDLVAYLTAHFPRRHVRAEKLRAEYKFCRDWVKRLDMEAQKMIVHFGVAPAARKIRLELKARNRTAPDAPDNAGKIWGKDVIIQGCPAIRSTRIDCHALRLGIPARMREHVALSEDPGRYLCNFIYYMTLQAAASGSDTDAIFIHVPRAGAKGGVSFQKQTGILLAILAELGKRTRP